MDGKDNKTKTLRKKYEDLKAYVYREMEGITITGLVILGAVSVLAGVYVTKKDHADINVTNKTKNIKETNSEDNNISWDEIENADVLKVKTSDGKEDILFVNYERIIVDGLTRYNVTDVLKEFPAFRVDGNKQDVLSDSFTIEEHLGSLLNYLTVNNYIENSYSKDGLESFRLEIKSTELYNKNKSNSKKRDRYNFNHKW